MFRRRTSGSGSAEPQIPGFLDFELIGSGGFSKVYTAHQVRFARTVAIKVVTVDLSPEASRRFEREQQTAGQLDGHPNVIRIYESGLTDQGRPYLVMEYHAQGSLSDRLRRHGTLPVAEVLDIGVRLADALDAAHRRGIVHRDVKPQNVLLSPYAGPVLADFGIAALDPGRFTLTTEAFSVNHAAPEVLSGEVATSASDLYSLASLLYELLAGRAPFADPDRPELFNLIRRVQEDPVPPIGRPDVSAAVEAAIVGLMARDPADRPASGAAFADHLVAVQGEAGLAETTRADRPSGASATDRRALDAWRPPSDGPQPSAWSPSAGPSDEARGAPSPPIVPPPVGDDLDHTIVPAAPISPPLAGVGTGTPAPAPAPAPGAVGGPSAPVEDGTIVRPRRPEAPPVPLGDDDASRPRWHYAALAAVAVAVLAIGIAIPLLRGRDGDAAPPARTSTTVSQPADFGACPPLHDINYPPGASGRTPPAKVAVEPVGLRGTSAKVTWADTNAGTALYGVLVRCSGGDASIQSVGQVAPGGKPEFVVKGLEKDHDYCFAVVAVTSAPEPAWGTTADGERLACFSD